MKSGRVQLESKLKSLVASRDELLHMLSQKRQQQQLVMSCFLPHPGSRTSAAIIDELVSIANNTTETVGALLDIAGDDYSDQLQDKTLTLLDHVSLLLALSSSTYCCEQSLSACSVAIAMDTSTRPYCDVVVAFLITFCVLAISLVEIWSAMSMVGCLVL